MYRKARLVARHQLNGFLQLSHRRVHADSSFAGGSQRGKIRARSINELYHPTELNISKGYSKGGLVNSFICILNGKATDIGGLSVVVMLRTIVARS